jgi:hypothetical protein
MLMGRADPDIIGVPAAELRRLHALIATLTAKLDDVCCEICEEDDPPFAGNWWVCGRHWNEMVSKWRATTAERDAARADADQLAAELDKHGYGDFHYGCGEGYRDKSVLAALAAHDDAVTRRGQP